MNRIVNDVNNLLKENLSNPVVSTVLHLFLVLYAGLAVPSLSGWLKGVFDNFAVRVVIIAIVAILNNYNPALALSASIVFILTLQTLSLAFNNDKLKEKVDVANDNVVSSQDNADVHADVHQDVTSAPVPAPSQVDKKKVLNDSFVGVDNDMADGPYKSLENDFGTPYDGLAPELTNNDY